ncbi:MAG TPA: aminodeoxychorismate/anthranilate synthase component II [Bacteroidia bacterium]|nr:aminodeoxychorismate/anthranilate synthase component II [Bacteroidia bacterium]
MQKILILDNYDSFTFNLVHYIEKITHADADVFRNDEISLEDVNRYDRIILSPGPGLPEEAGILIPLIKKYAATKKILGVCLGHQAIGEVFGAKLFNLTEVFHGLSREVNVIDKNEKLFTGIPSSFNAGRYHSWVIDKTTLPSCLKITSVDNNNEIMSVSHIDYDVKGVQFHPESILTEHGEKLLENWLLQF